MDLSYSMKDDLEKIKHLGQDILNTLSKFTDKIRIGFGSFVDKVVLPYVSQVKKKKRNPCPSRADDCQPAFSFQNILKLTEHAADFKRKVSSQKISGNLDSPEAGLDAIMQAAVCQDVIGWANVTRILVYTSDDTFHIAGDGSLAGIYEPHDGKCHLNGSGFYDGTKYDYPSIGHLSRVLSANNIQLIFAVTKKSVPDYEALSKLIPQSVVGVLENDSSNVVELISQAYNNLSSTLFLETHGAPDGLDVVYQSHCVLDKGDTPWRKRGECMNVKINQEVSFAVRLNISTCLQEPQEFHLKVQGISETLKVVVETLCNCNCLDDEPSSPHCNRIGTLSCGICSCDSGFTGQKCECEQQSKGVTSLDATCRESNTARLCSGHGRCECGTCVCHHGRKGVFCQCDNTNCKRHNNVLCGGNGVCDCGKCKCSAGYTGEACECSTLTNKCAKEGKKLCSGHGTCRCNQCLCNDGIIGPLCSEVNNACQRYKNCMICIAEENGVWNKNCTEKCFSFKPERVDGVKDLPCSTDDFMYEVTASEDGTILIHYTDLPRAVDKTIVIIGSTVSSIIFIGLAVIIISRLLLELHYRREYRSFLKEQEEESVWKENNSLFLTATTTVKNPMHNDSDLLND